VIQPDGKNLRTLTSPGVTAGSPKWSPDGKRIVWYEMNPAQTSQARMVGGGGAPPAQIVSVDVATGTRIEHTSGPGLKVSPQFPSADRIGYAIKAAPSAGPTPGLAFTTRIEPRQRHERRLVLTFINTVAFGHRRIPPRGVARRSNTPGILAPRALRSGRLGALGASPYL